MNKNERRKIRSQRQAGSITLVEKKEKCSRKELLYLLDNQNRLYIKLLFCFFHNGRDLFCKARHIKKFKLYNQWSFRAKVKLASNCPLSAFTSFFALNETPDLHRGTHFYPVNLIIPFAFLCKEHLSDHHIFI